MLAIMSNTFPVMFLLPCVWVFASWVVPGVSMSVSREKMTDGRQRLHGASAP
jgi:hypothetical protein